ncbi:MAG: ATP-binding cassette domain-containing protein, partial [Flavobacteriaceae bacterium]|nr:ATP-binding cassette domain-containing protein [Flavobacteriaceae bacterium]
MQLTVTHLHIWSSREVYHHRLLMLTLENISKSFGNNLILNKIQLNLNPGIYGLLGPNGAGKSALFRIIGTILTPDQGSVFFNGVPIEKENFQAYKGNLGYMPQDFGFYPGFSVERL